ncbi:BgTH12-05123 [Blumeria graminis f. sp. triticale]|uniref:BgTH12-05123 n=1 Tax=Blumeria graminis f. sp. triticale TaxID=1689686 RepID=A0A9W4D5Y2_BLUGR|nr:BgTH12-05123 [Blumeria graminis f. sp. triticale]
MSKYLDHATDKNITPLNLTCGLHDAIQGHRSFYMKSKVFYRYISTNNITLIDLELNGNCCGVLVNLDLAISMSDETFPVDANIQIIMMEFIVLGYLETLNIQGVKKLFIHIDTICQV